MTKYIIFYGENDYITDEQFSPDKIDRARGVQVIIQVDRYSGWTATSHRDYYVWDERGRDAKWWGVDYPGLIDYLLEPGWKRVLFGRTLTSDEFDVIFRSAQNNEYLPKKTSYSFAEIHPKDDNI